MLNETLNYNLFNTIIFSGIIYGIVFCFVIGFNKSFVSPVKKYLILTILTLSLSNLQYWFIDVGVLNIPRGYYFQFEFLMLPFLYLFLVRYMGLKKKKLEILLFLPFIVFMGYQLLRNPQLVSKIDLFGFGMIKELSAIFFNLTLIIVCLLKILAYEKKQLPVKISTSWIKYAILGGIGLCILWIFITKFFYFNGDFTYYYSLWIGVSILIYYVGNRAMVELRTFTDRKNIRERKKSKTDFNPSNLNSASSKGYDLFCKIETAIRDGEMYLDPIITLGSVAELFDISNGYLSQIMSQYTDDGFVSFINGLRVETAKKMLNNSDFDSYTIVAIGLESGFNSKSTFFSSFKKLTGITPVKYKNSVGQ